MKSATNLATAILLSLSLVACGGGGSGGGSQPSNNNNDSGKATPINPSAKTKYEKDFIDSQSDKDDVIVLTSTENKKVYESKDGTKVSLTYAPQNASTPVKPVFGKEFDKTKYQAIANGADNKVAVEKLDAHFAGEVVAYIGDDVNKITRRNVVFSIEEKQIFGHSTKKSQDDVQIIFEKTGIIERNSNSHNPQGIGFEGIVVVQGKTKETGNYFGYFFGKGTDVKGLVGDFNVTSNASGHQGSYYAEKEAK